MLLTNITWQWLQLELDYSGIKMHDKYPLVTVGALIFNKKNQILFLKSDKWKGQYGIPSGKLEYGEDIINGLKREIKEETGLGVYDIKVLLNQEIINPKDFFKKSHFISINHTCKAKNSKVKLNYETQSYRWVRWDNALKLRLNEPTRQLIGYYLKLINKDKIIIKDLEIECIVGIRKRERVKKQKILVTVEIFFDIKKSAKTKNIKHTIDYSSLSKKIESLVINKKYLLLETMAEDISKLILKNKKINRVKILIKKPKALPNGTYAGIEIIRP